MCIAEIRRKNLGLLIAKEGTLRSLADKINTASNYLSEIKNHQRDMGSRLARKIEQSLSLTDGWMDRPQGTLSALSYVQASSLEDLARQLASKPDEDIGRLIQLLLHHRHIMASLGQS